MADFTNFVDSDNHLNLSESLEPRWRKARTQWDRPPFFSTRIFRLALKRPASPSLGLIPFFSLPASVRPATDILAACLRDPTKDFDFGLNKMLDYLDKENVAIFNLYRNSITDKQGHLELVRQSRQGDSWRLACVANVDCFREAQVETACLLPQEEVAGRLRKIR